MKINKRKKGLVSLIAGAALIAGTAGTFALWFDTAALGADDQTVATGDLAIDASNIGRWVWENQSHGEDRVNTLFDGDFLVPGDAVSYDWAVTEDGDLVALENFVLTGDTLVATFYLDGVGDVDAATIYPLVLRVNGAAPTIVEGNVVLATGLIEGQVPGVGEVPGLPSIFIGFPYLASPIAPRQANPDDNYGFGYGRNITGQDAIDISNLQIRLQQQIGSLAFDGN